ncbi:MAG: universal stress protein [Burkholderiales bacterium]
MAEIAGRLPHGVSTRESVVASATASSGAQTTLKVLIPIDGSENSLRALRHAIVEYQRHHELELHLLNVQPRLSSHVARFVSRHDRDAWHAGQADKALVGARTVLDAAGVPHHVHWALGKRAAEICRGASQLGVHHIVMGTARKNSITRMFEDSVTVKVLQGTTVPVEVIAGDTVSKWESWGLPAEVLGAGALMWLATG